MAAPVAGAEDVAFIHDQQLFSQRDVEQRLRDIVWAVQTVLPYGDHPLAEGVARFVARKAAPAARAAAR